MMEKLCVFCNHWRFEGGEPHYSARTPGEDARMDCAKGHYGRSFRMHNIYNEDGFREIIEKAKTCPDYSQFEPPHRTE